MTDVDNVVSQHPTSMSRITELQTVERSVQRSFPFRRAKIMNKTIENVLCVLLLAAVRLAAAAETPAEYITRCQSLASTAAIDVKNEACEVVEGLCDSSTMYSPPPLPPPPQNPKSLEKKAMMETCRILMRTDCTSLVFQSIFADYPSECYFLTVFGPETSIPGCEDEYVVMERLQQEVRDRCNKLETPEWIPQAAAYQ
ncbi:hypothetical protein BSKO_05830 [Bryopsis sp. KO-2023]|nr:hypothetical protein BSKO_05830 [Bryopsis sp. KO-2023]